MATHGVVGIYTKLTRPRRNVCKRNCQDHPMRMRHRETSILPNGGVLKRTSLFHESVLRFVMLGTISAVAQTNSYQQTNLVSDMAGAAAHTDPKLINPWGIALVPGQPFWVADNNSGYTTIYDANGVTQLQPVLIPAPPGDASPSNTDGNCY